MRQTENRIPCPELLTELLPGYPLPSSSGCAHWLCTWSRNGSGAIQAGVKPFRDTCGHSSSSWTIKTLVPKKLAFPQKEEKERRKRLTPGASQRGAYLPQRDFTVLTTSQTILRERLSVMDHVSTRTACAPKHTLCPLLKPKLHVRTLKMYLRGRREVSLGLFICSSSQCSRTG